MSEAIQTVEALVKMEPMSHGRTDLRKKKPKIIAVILDNCTGCAGSPVCVEYCPVEACMFWVPDPDYPPAGRIEVDPNLCIGCKLCTSKGPDGTFLEGCPWDAIEMMPVEEWEAKTGIQLNP
jgi:ferredoxin